jgi:acetoin utilization protein AcuC
VPSRDAAGPLLVFGPRSTAYDFGSSHPLTPRRFGPGIDLLRAVGAEPGLTPEPATDAELEWIHDPDYVATVRALSGRGGPALAGGLSPAAFGLGPGDTPAFIGLHDAAAAVAGGSLRAMEAILAGDVQHAFHPGGGLHHAMPRRASGFCVYDDPALAIARARRDGLRVLYLDFDVHHGDGVQAIHWNDPEVVTISFHETGRALFPGTGFMNELGGPDAAGSKLNVPLDPGTGERGWLAAVERVVPEVAEAFRPEVVVSQHGSDGHAWDPLAHLRLTTTAMGAAARLVDSVAHRWAGGRWLATGGGGYDAYRVVPRVWSLVWLAGAHREAPPRLPDAWLERWTEEAEGYGQAPLPERFEDPPNAGQPFGPADDALDARALASAEATLAAWRSLRRAPRDESRPGSPPRRSAI